MITPISSYSSVGSRAGKAFSKSQWRKFWAMSSWLFRATEKERSTKDKMEGVGAYQKAFLKAKGKKP